MYELEMNSIWCCMPDTDTDPPADGPDGGS